jgi:hypothetical protein
MGRMLSEFRLPRPRHDWSQDRSNPLIRHELDYDRMAEQSAFEEVYQCLNEDQKRNFDIIIAIIRNDPHSKSFPIKPLVNIFELREIFMCCLI